jgi:hypothetical protein
MLVGDTQRITEYAKRGYSIPQDAPLEVEDAYAHLMREGFTDRLV